MTKPADDLPQVLRQNGVTDPTHHATAEKLAALGMTRQEILAFIMANSPGVLTFAARILELFANRPGAAPPSA